MNYLARSQLVFRVNSRLPIGNYQRNLRLCFKQKAGFCTNKSNEGFPSQNEKVHQHEESNKTNEEEIESERIIPNQKKAKREDYFPEKRLNFSNRSLFPLFLEDYVVDREPSTFQRACRFYSFFLAYLISWGTFCDLYYYPHYVVLVTLFAQGTHAFFLNEHEASTKVLKLWLHKDGKTMIIELPYSTDFEHLHQKDVSIPEDAVHEGSIFMQGKLDENISFCYNEKIVRRKTKTTDEKIEEKTQNTTLKNFFIDKDEIKVPDKNNIILKYYTDIDKYIPFGLQLSNNRNYYYNDYFRAFSEQKNLILQETKLS